MKFVLSDSMGRNHLHAAHVNAWKCHLREQDRRRQARRKLAPKGAAHFSRSMK